MLNAVFCGSIGNERREMAKGPPSETPAPNSPNAQTVDGAPPAQPVRGGNAPRPKLDLTDKMLGDFRVLRRLGEGGMAQVYLAEQTSLKRNVAIKVLHQDRVADGSYLKRFK